MRYHHGDSPGGEVDGRAFGGLDEGVGLLRSLTLVYNYNVIVEKEGTYI